MIKLRSQQMIMLLMYVITLLKPKQFKVLGLDMCLASRSLISRLVPFL